MITDKKIGILFIVGAIGVFIPYTLLTMSFNYPDILRQEPGKILESFYRGGSRLVYTWLAFATLGLPLLIAYILLGQKLENKLPYVRWITTVGVISAIVQMIGLLRWVFVVPILAKEYVASANENTRASVSTAFTLMHQFGGVLLGEHIGQLFTIIWTIGTSMALRKLRIIPAWMACWGIIASVIYLMAQAELLATVIPGSHTWDAAGFLGSTLWLVWLVLVGAQLCRTRSLHKIR